MPAVTAVVDLFEVSPSLRDPFATVPVYESVTRGYLCDSCSIRIPHDGDPFAHLVLCPSLFDRADLEWVGYLRSGLRARRVAMTHGPGAFIGLGSAWRVLDEMGKTATRVLNRELWRRRLRHPSLGPLLVRAILAPTNPNGWAWSTAFAAELTRNAAVLIHAGLQGWIVDPDEPERFT